MEHIGWIFTVLAMAGTFINARGNRACFYVWIISNTGFIGVSVITGAYPQAALFTFNLAMCGVGLKKWKKQ